MKRFEIHVQQRGPVVSLSLWSSGARLPWDCLDQDRARLFLEALKLGHVGMEGSGAQVVIVVEEAR